MYHRVFAISHDIVPFLGKLNGAPIEPTTNSRRGELNDRFAWLICGFVRIVSGMRLTRFAFLFAARAFVAQLSFGQDPLLNVLKMGYTDVAETKRKAEAGDPAAQLSLGNTFASNLRTS